MSDYQAPANRGSLWHENNVKVVRKGKIKFGEKEKYCSILKFEDKDGNEKFELAVSVGLLHYNSPEEKRSPKSPDIYGKITWEDEVYKFGGYANVTDNGTEYTGVRLRPESEEQEFEQRKTTAKF
jgi:hypothetical protein